MSLWLWGFALNVNSFSHEDEKISLFFPLRWGTYISSCHLDVPCGHILNAVGSTCLGQPLTSSKVWICSWWLGGYLLSLTANAPGFTVETISAKSILLSSRVRMNHTLEWRRMKETIHKEYREKYLFHWSIICNFLTKGMFKIIHTCILISWKAFTSNQSPQIWPSDQRKQK